MNNLDKLIIPWSINPMDNELIYKKNGFIRTKGTIFSIPPERIDLINSFLLSHKNTKLCVGARALSKHYVRQHNHSYWEKPSGSPENQNKIAQKFLFMIIDNPSWKNIFHFKNTILLEIRNSKGYGARWSLHPLKFRGFLEDKSPFEK